MKIAGMRSDTREEFAAVDVRMNKKWDPQLFGIVAEDRIRLIISSDDKRNFEMLQICANDPKRDAPKVHRQNNRCAEVCGG